jgi:uncharacterized membrane protein
MQKCEKPPILSMPASNIVYLSDSNSIQKRKFGQVRNFKKSHFMRFLLFSLIIAAFFSCNNDRNKKTGDDSVNGQNDSIIAGDTIRRNEKNNNSDTVFRGMGTEPFWAVYIINNEKIVYHPADGEMISVPYVEAVSPDNITTKFNSANDSVTVELSLVKKNCNNGMSDIVYPYGVNLKINAMTLKGCGDYTKH